MATITEQGIQIQRLDQILITLENGFKTIYGQNIDTAPDSPDGQFIGILGQMKMDIEELCETVYKQVDPDLASGAWLDQRVAYAGLIRRTASYSYLRSVILTGNPQTLIRSGLVVSDANKTRWILIRDISLSDKGSAQADFRSEQLGAFNLQAGQELTIETITLGLAKAVSGHGAEIGKEEETDPELRYRFYRSRAKNARNSVEALEAKISELADVKQVAVFENCESVINKYGIEPHFIYVIVDGGKEQTIAQAIYQNKGAGVGLKGTTSVTLDLEGRKRIIRYEKAKTIDIAVTMRVVRYEDFTEVDKGQIKKLLSGLKFSIGDDVRLSRLYTPINAVGGFWVKELKISKKGGDLKAENIVINIHELARILENDIIIEVE